MENNLIIFRAWHIPKKKMFLVDYLDFKENCRSVGLVDMEFNDAMRCDDRRDVVLMQFTGLKDKNGKHIYEGDICEPVQAAFQTQEKDVIVFENGCFWIKNSIRDTSSGILHYPKGCYPLYKINTESYLKIIGNIYANPELL